MARDEAINIHMAVDRRSPPTRGKRRTPGALGSIGGPGAAVMAQAQMASASLPSSRTALGLGVLPTARA